MVEDSVANLLTPQNKQQHLDPQIHLNGNQSFLQKITSKGTACSASGLWAVSTNERRNRAIDGDPLGTMSSSSIVLSANRSKAIPRRTKISSAPGYVEDDAYTTSARKRSSMWH